MLRLAAHKKVNEQQQQEDAAGGRRASRNRPSQALPTATLGGVAVKEFLTEFRSQFQFHFLPRSPLVLFWRRQALLVQ